MNTRLENLDLLKAIAIFFVVIYHFNNIQSEVISSQNNWNYLNYYLKTILSTCVPIFFFVNGLLLLNKKSVDIYQHVKKIVNILALTFVWGIIMIMSSIFLNNNLEKLTLLQIVKGAWLLKQNYNHYLWFLQTLLIIYIFYPLIYCAFNSQRKVLYFFFSCVMLFTFGNVILANLATVLSALTNRFNNSNLQLNYFAGFNPFTGIHGYSLGYFILGGIIGSEYELLSSLLQDRLKFFSKFLMPISMFFLFTIGLLESFRSGNTWDLVWNGYDSIFTFVNVIFLYIMSRNYKSIGTIGKIVRLLSINSLGIYFIHIIIGNALHPYYSKFNYTNILVVNVFYAVIILVFSLIVTLILKKIPFLKYLISI